MISPGKLLAALAMMAASDSSLNQRNGKFKLPAEGIEPAPKQDKAAAKKAKRKKAAGKKKRGY